MSHMNNKGFLLIDSLISVFITSVICLLCYSLYTAMVNYEDGYRQYQETFNQNMVNILASLNECETCQIKEEVLEDESN